MIPRLPKALPITLIALAALSAAGYHRIRPSHDTAAKNEPRSAAPQAQNLASQPIPTPPQPPADAVAPPPAPRMTGAQEADFEAWIVKAYLGCWKQPAAAPESDPYVARVRLAFKPDGSLAKTPKLVNPPSDPALKPQAKSVMQAVQACNPLSVPAQYRPFYEQWRTKTIQFSPQVAAR